MAKPFDDLGRILFGLLRKKQYGRLALALAVIALAVAIQYWQAQNLPAADELKTNLLNNDNVAVSRVIDGDTFAYEADGDEHVVRLLGVNTPETKDPRKPVECFGEEAHRYSASLLEGKSVRLESDPASQDLDKYQRELRYVYLPDGTMLNELLLLNGFALATPEYPFTLSEEFVKLENEASFAGRGLWNKLACP